MPVTFEELVESPVVALDDGHFSATRRFKIAWSDTIAFTVELLGGWSAVDGALVYTPPAVFPSVPQAVPRRVRFTPFPADRIDVPASTSLSASTNLPPFAVVTAEYEIPDHANGQQFRRDRPAVPAGTFLTVHVDVGSESLHVPGRAWKWPDGRPVPEDTQPGLVIPTEQIRCRWERVPLALVPWDALRDTRGKLNAAPFLNHAPGTVLFLGARSVHEFQLTGDVLVRLDYLFSAREVTSTADHHTLFGWNHFFREQPLGGEHWQPITDDDGRRPYELTDFGPLFEFAP